ncbi:MAG TPA: hypothetical protein EYP62_01355 [Kiritimatiellae bacterium]|nr:hypothetical protein [Kiritimatiellia bacterium]
MITARHSREAGSKRFALRLLPLTALLALLCSCSTSRVAWARRDFFAGRFERAYEHLSAPVPARDRVLWLMERGTILQAAGRFEESARDYIGAAGIVGDLETYSISKGAASLVINDAVQDFRGTPFERTLLHSMTALDHLALGNWENAAVEARRIIMSLDKELIGDFPQDAFSRYLAGFCLEMVDDYSNARLQYRLASQYSRGCGVDERTGRLQPPSANVAADSSAAEGDCELVFFALLGRSPTAYQVVNGRIPDLAAPYVEILADGKYLGRTCVLGDVGWLAAVTEQRLALIKAGKTAARVVVKEAVARSVARNTHSTALGDLTRLVLIGLLETPDMRRWETLPRWLEVARVSAPCQIDRIEVRVRSAAGQLLKSFCLRVPIRRRRGLMVSFFRYPPLAPVVSQETDAATRGRDGIVSRESRHAATLQ